MKQIILIFCFCVLYLEVHAQELVSKWSFDHFENDLVNEDVADKTDRLLGLKENVIVGRLVPAGTGSIKNNWNKKALEDDNKFIAELEKLESPETQVNQ